MAKMHGPFSFTGKLGDVSVYQMKGVDRLVARLTYAASKKAIKTQARYAGTRKENKEFGGRSTASHWVMQGFWPLKPLADIRTASRLQTVLTRIQKLDTESQRGKRHILISRMPDLLEGFSLTREHPFDSVVRQPLTYSLSRESVKAQVEIPQLIPGINLFIPKQYPLYQLVAVLGAVPDVFYNPSGYAPGNNYRGLSGRIEETEWFSTKSGSPATSLEVSLPHTPPDEAFSLMLSVGIRYGTVGAGSSIERERQEGSAKVLAMV